MARLQRLFVAGYSHHVIQRGNNRQPCFYADEDYQYYLHLVKEFGEKYQVAIHAFVLMPNHVHMLVTPEHETGISKMMQSIGRVYVQHFNLSYQRTGTLWEGRFKSTLVDTEFYWLQVSRYIELNPVRAGLVTHPSGYCWSSYQANGLGAFEAVLTHHALYLGLGAKKSGRLKNYRMLLQTGCSENIDDEIRAATNKGWALGGDEFLDVVQKRCSRAVRPKRRGGDRRSLKFRGAGVEK